MNSRRWFVFSSILLAFITLFVVEFYSAAQITQQTASTVARRRPDFKRFDDYGKSRLTSCNPVKKIVFLKTHKTASSTVAAIIDRYALNHHLSAPVLGYTRNISHCFHFEHTSVSAFNQLDIVTQHLRYSRNEFDLAIPGAKHVTILRHPVSQFESAFAFYDVAKQLNISNSTNPIEEFFHKPDDYIAKKFPRWETVYNYQLFDLGFDTNLSKNHRAVESKIKQLSKEFDLVMITEYFDESLILLKQMLCWGFEHIIYLPKNKRSAMSLHYQLSDSVVSKISRWNEADVKLFRHFNTTFWNKIDEYGDVFYTELREFKSRLKLVQERCVASTKHVLKKKRGKMLFEEYELRRDLSIDDLTVCQGLLKEHSELYKLIRDDMVNQGVINVDDFQKVIDRNKQVC